MEQNMRFGLVLGRLAVLKISDWVVNKSYAFLGQFFKLFTVEYTFF